MSDSASYSSRADLRSALKIITVLVDAVRSSSDLIVRLAPLVGEEQIRAIQSDPVWAEYRDGKRKLEELHDDLHHFVSAATAFIEVENARIEQEEARRAAEAEPEPEPEPEP
jgi:hypothetical protein